MSIWSRIRDYIAEIGQNNLLAEILRGPPEESVTFTISIIALSAKMAKADGHVTRDEIITLRQIFEFNDRDEKDIARVFDLARKDIAGFDEYAKRIRRLFAGNPKMLEDIFEGLFQIAMADGEFHENEEAFLDQVHEVFQIRKSFYRRLKKLYVPGADPDPYHVLGITPNASEADIKYAYRTIIRENHPDVLQARGLPEEAIAMAEHRVRTANAAYDILTSS